MADDSLPAIDDLVVALLDRVESSGSSVDDVLEELCSTHPRRAVELRDSVRALRQTGLLPAGDAPALPKRLGDFRLLRCLGQGGMGVVHIAEQVSLGRRVALKLIRPENLYFEGARARFRREVEAAGRLSHPGVVAVHTVGEEQGVPYLAMELVAGASLDAVMLSVVGRSPEGLTGADLRAAVEERVVADFPGQTRAWDGAFFAGSWAEVALRVARAVAEALAHAHERGVLHRDVKPSNVMLTPEGRVVLLDFGLASLAGSERVTRSGSQLGSLPYMAPEQVAGRVEAIDARTDVYGLGVALYELLTLRLPFAEGRAEVTRQAILEGRAAPPRSHNPALSRDVETVCLTAMERDPGRRYSTAADLARDLANLLELRPIAARPAGPVRRLARWAQRRPAAALGVLFLVAGPLGWLLTTKWALGQVTAAKVGEQDAQESAVREFWRTFELAVDMRYLGDTGLENTPHMQGARLDSVEKTMARFDEMESDAPPEVLGSPRFRRERARLHRSRGDVLDELGRPAEAISEYDRHIAIYAEFAAADPANLVDAWDLAGCLHQKARALQRAGLCAESLPVFADSLTGMDAVVSASPGDPEKRRDLATALTNQGRSFEVLDRVEAAEEAYGEALAIARELHAADPGPAVTRTLASAHSALAALWAGNGELDRARAAAQRSLALLEPLHEADPRDRTVANELANALLTSALVHRVGGELGEAEVPGARAVDLLEEQVRDFPQVSGLRMSLVAALTGLGTSRALGGQSDGAEESFVAAVEHCEILLEQAPGNLAVMSRAAASKVNLASFSVVYRGDWERSLPLIERALEHLGPCLAGSPGDHEYRQIEIRARYVLALAQCRADRVQEARSEAQAFEALVGGGGEAEHLRWSADLWNEWLLSLRRVVPDPSERADGSAHGRERMLDMLARAIDAGFDDARELATNPALDPFRDDPELQALLEFLEGR